MLSGKVKRKIFFSLSKNYVESGISPCKIIYIWLHSINFQAVKPGFDSKQIFGKKRSLNNTENNSIRKYIISWKDSTIHLSGFFQLSHPRKLYPYIIMRNKAVVRFMSAFLPPSSFTLQRQCNDHNEIKHRKVCGKLKSALKCLLIATIITATRC